MHRYKFIIEYDGTPFCGWQVQSSSRKASVEIILKNAVEKLLKHSVKIYAAGRTDSGVHAIGQVVHFDSDIEIEIYKFIKSVNYFMRPYPVHIISGQEVDMEFHARFSARQRTYHYYILNRSIPSVLLTNKVWSIPKPLDCTAMEEGARKMVGKHDFASFRSVNCQSKTSIKSIDALKIEYLDDALVKICISAPSFMHNQVRIITGCLVNIGLNVWQKEYIDYLLEVKDRRKAGITAPSCGLYFYEVKYC